jgi:hypothetical protein
MAEVIAIAGHRLHLTLYVGNAAHIIPHALIHSIIAGKQPSSVVVY